MGDIQFNGTQEEWDKNKEQQKKLIIEIMEDDEKDGLYDSGISKIETTQTAVEWLKDMLEWNYGDPQMLEISWKNLDDLIERAKQMEKKQIITAYINKELQQGYEAEAEQYYNETYNK